MFDEINMLPPLLANIQQRNIDYIQIIYQDQSYTGLPAQKVIYPDLKILLDSHKIHAIEKFDPDLDLRPKHNELNKRNMGRASCRDAKCDYHQSIDIDEYFRPNEFANALSAVIANGYGFTVCPIYSYVYSQSSKYLYRWKETCDKHCFSPLLYAINEKNFMCKSPLPLSGNRIDETRYLLGEKSYCFSSDEICMHHMHMVRKDLHRKFATKAAFSDTSNHSAQKQKEHYKSISVGSKIATDPFYGAEVVKVDDEFLVIPAMQ